MKKYSPKEYVVEFFKRVHEMISGDYRMSVFETMQESGELENMCASEFYKRFKVRGNIVFD